MAGLLIMTAGMSSMRLALAVSFALLALVPPDQFREIAAAMALGIVLDTFVVRRSGCHRTLNCKR